MQRQIQAFLTALLMLLFICSQSFAASTANTWTGSGPFATGLGNKIITALAVSPDGGTVYAGTMSGTVLSYAVTPPAAITDAASGVAATAATLNGTVNANNADSAVSFRYGTDTNYTLGTVAASPATVTGATGTAVSASLGALTPGTVYHYQVVATSTSGTTYGSDETFTTPKWTQGISFGTTPTVVVDGTGSVSASVNVNGGPGSGNSVVFSTDSADCSVSGNTITGKAAGTTNCVIKANLAGSATYDPAPQATLSISIGKGTQPTLVIGSLPASAVYNQSGIVATTTGGKGTGAITFSHGSSDACTVNISTGAVTITSGTGTCSITAAKDADSNYNAAVSSAATVTINKADQAPLTLNGLPASAIYAQSGIVASANGGSSTGAVSYSHGSSTACTVNGSSGVVTITKGSGTCAITATKDADVNFSSITTATATITVSPATQQTLTIADLPASAVYGQSGLLASTTGGSGTGAITFSHGSSNGCTIDASTGAVTITSGSGTCAITATKGSDSGYGEITSAPFTVSIGKAPQGTFAITGPGVMTYGNADATITTSGGSGNGDVTFEATGSACSIVNGKLHIITGTGTCSVTATKAADDNYNQTASTAVPVTVARAPQTISVAAQITRTYGDADFGPGAIASSGLPVTYSIADPAVATVTDAGLVHITGVGGTGITANQAGNADYLPAATGLGLVVNKAMLLVTANNASRTVGTDNPTFGATYSGFVNGETAAVLSGTLTFLTPADINSLAGDYPIFPNPSSVTAANYMLFPVPGTLAVGKQSQTITFRPVPAKTYGDADFTLDVTSNTGTPIVYFVDSNVATITGNTVHIVGPGTTIIEAMQPGNASYASGIALQVLTVNRPTLTVSAPNLEKAVSDPVPPLSYAVAGFVNGDTEGTACTGTPLLSTVADASSPVGSYPITVAQGTLACSKYDIIYAAGSLAVGLQSQTITFNPLPATTYGDPAFELSATGGGSGNLITLESTNPAVATVSGATVTITGAGTATIVARQAGNDSYAPTSARQVLTVRRKMLTVAAVGQSRVYNVANPAFTASYSGFAYNETQAVLAGAPELTTTAATDSTVGSYPITIAPGNLSAANYDFTYNNATLTVSQATPVITWNNPADITFGTTLGATQLNATASVDGTMTYTPASGAVLNAGQAQSLRVEFTPADTVNYINASKAVAINVNKAVAPVSLNGTSLMAAYDGMAKHVSITTTPANLAVTVTYNGSTTVPAASGIYTVVATINDSNYQGSATGTLTIGKAAQIITLGTAPTLITGGTGTLSATATSGLTVSFASVTPSICTVSGSTVTGVAPGTCTVAANQAGDGNYTGASQVTQDIPVTVSITLSVSALANGATTTETTQNVSGTVTNPTYLSTLTINGLAVTVTTDGSFSYPVQLVAGANTITVIATSTAGDVLTDSRTVTLDTTTVGIAIAAPMDNAVVIQPFTTVSGTVTPATATTVTCTVNGGTAQAASISGGDFTCTSNLIPGMNTIVITATDGNHSAQAKRTVTYAPTFTLGITDPASDMRTVKSSYTLTGSVADNTTPVTVIITMDGQTYSPAVTDGSFSQTLTFTEGKVYQVTVTGTDQNGNTVTVQRNIIYSTPTVTPFTIEDALKALQMAVGVIPPQADLVQRLDVAPMVNGVSAGDGIIDVEDAIVILRIVVGLI